MFRSYNYCIRFSRILADVIEILHKSAISSAVLILIPHKTHAEQVRHQLENGENEHE